MRGPLAPKRDAGPEGKGFGTLSPQAMNPPLIPKHLRRKYINIAPGDRVCVIKGNDKGKINEVTRVDPNNETITVKDTNMVWTLSTGRMSGEWCISITDCVSFFYRSTCNSRNG